MKRSSQRAAKKVGSHDSRLYVLEVSILSGPMTEDFAKRNPVISRTIQIRGVQTLAQLHKTIFAAFDREEEHMYEFRFGNSPHDPTGKRFVLAMPLEDPIGSGQECAGDV